MAAPLLSFGAFVRVRSRFERHVEILKRGSILAGCMVVLTLTLCPGASAQVANPNGQIAAQI